MNKRGQGGSELRVQEVKAHHHRTAGVCQLSAGKLRCQSSYGAELRLHGPNVLGVRIYWLVPSSSGGNCSPYFQINQGSSKPRNNRGTKVRGCANNRQSQPRKKRSAQSGITIWSPVRK